MGLYDYIHVTNVSNTIERILSRLGYPADLIEEAKIAAILHEVGNTQGKDNHEIISYEFARDYIDRKNIKLKYKDEVLEAIRVHRNGFDTDNIIALVLIFADKLDVTKDRVADYGHQVIGMRQLTYINNVSIKIDHNHLNVCFDADSQINVNELKKFCFMYKVVKSVFSFANKVDLIPEVSINNQRLNIVGEEVE